MASKVMQNFNQKLARNLQLANYKANQVKFPHVEQMTVNLCYGPADALSGLRYFNRDLAPGFRLANDELRWVVKSASRDASVRKSTVEILFKDGKSTTYDAFNKDSVQIYNDLAKLARGNYWLKNQFRKPAKPNLGKPELTFVDQ